VQQLSVRWAQAPSRFVDISGMQVHVRDEGPRDDPVPVVLLHGTSASLHTWDGWVDALKVNRRVIRFDLPGFGLTGPNPTGDYSMAAYVKFVAAVMDQLGVKKFDIAGNSLGGQIAWQSAYAMPERVSKLVLVDSAGYPSQPVSVPIGFRIARIPGLRSVMEYVLPRGVVKGSVRNLYGEPEKITEELIDRYYELTLRAGNRNALTKRFDQVVTTDNEKIKTLKLPTLIIWGGKDRLIPPDNALRFEADIVGSQRVVFDNLGHVPHEEDAKTTVKPVLAFLNSK
jgi:pimeloyl-ACP methyl ester carboxylesterase